VYNKSTQSISHVQTTDGKAPSGFTATEFQEWFRQKAFPAMQECADRYFVRKPANSNHGFTAALQASNKKLETATYFNHRYHMKFLISHDQDSRHSYKHYPLTSGGHKGKPFDRRNITKRKPLHIGVHEKQDYVPTAPRVPDCIQSPIKMFFVSVKGHFKKLLAQCRREGMQSTFEAVVQQSLEALERRVGLIGQAGARSTLCRNLFESSPHRTRHGSQLVRTGSWVWVATGYQRSIVASRYDDVQLEAEIFQWGRLDTPVRDSSPLSLISCRKLFGIWRGQFFSM
jgi:hypothetical protein